MVVDTRRARERDNGFGFGLPLRLVSIFFVIVSFFPRIVKGVWSIFIFIYLLLFHVGPSLSRLPPGVRESVPVLCFP